MYPILYIKGFFFQIHIFFYLDMLTTIPAGQGFIILQSREGLSMIMISVAAAIGVPMKLTPWVYINFNTYYIERLIFLL